MEHLKVLGDVTRHTAEVYRDKTAFMNRGRAVSFSEFNNRVNRLCSALADLGLVKGDRVAFLCRNRTECVEAYCVGKAGFVGMPLNWRLTPFELALLLKNSGATVIMADEYHEQAVESLRGELPKLKHFIAMDHPGKDWISYEGLLAGASESDPGAIVEPEDPLCLFYTSGTTGTPKGVVLTHRGLMHNACEMASIGLKLTPEDITLTVMPLFHVGGMWYHLFASYLAGCTTFIEESFDPVRTLDALERYHVTNIHLVPTMIGALLNVKGVEVVGLEHLRLMFYAGSNIPEDMLRRALAVFKRAGFLQSYGSTEGGICTILYPKDHEEAVRSPGREGLLNSCGKAFGNLSIRVDGPEGNSVREGEIGEVAVRSVKTMRGYWNNPEADRNAIADGWVRMGDLGYLDKEGYLYIVGRKHDMIVTGGENVFPHEVESVLFENDKIQDAAVFSIPDPKWVEAVAAAVVLKEGVEADAAEIISQCKKRLAAYKCPKVILFTDSLPKTPSGKILKRKLRETYGKK